MDFKDKLDFYKSGGRQKRQTESEPAPAALRALADYFTAEICSHSAPFLKIERREETKLYTPENKKKISLSLLSKGDNAVPIDPEKCLFFDLETTGLAGGAGTFAFLLGFGMIREGRVYVDQYFLPDYGREYYLFKQLTELFARFDFLISYNGKSYDLPLLKNRFILNQMEHDFDRLKHLDLLHIVRRIWKDSLASCDLISIERHVLNRRRQNDIPGFMIPQAYFDFLRSGVVHEVKRLIEHNYYDIVSLAELFIVLDKIEENPASLKDARALIRLAKLAFEQKDTNQFQKIFNAYTTHASEPDDAELKVWQSLLKKKQREWPDALRIWEELLSHRNFTLFALEELAKYYEHVEKDHQMALQYTDRALKRFEWNNELYTDTISQDELLAFRRRKKRLMVKLS